MQQITINAESTRFPRASTSVCAKGGGLSYDYDSRHVHTERVYVRRRAVDARLHASTDVDGRRRARCEWAFDDRRRRADISYLA